LLLFFGELVVLGRAVLSSRDPSSLGHSSLDAFLDENVEFLTDPLRIFQYSPVPNDCIDFGSGEFSGIVTEHSEPFAMLCRA
jgi:hypothetical protein